MEKNIHAIDYPFAIDGGLGQLAVETNYDVHVEHLIKQVLFTNPGERINRPDFGCGIRRMIFAPNSTESASLAQVTIYQALESWLANVIKVDQVDVKAQEEILTINISYWLKARNERRYLNMEVSI